jgi:hypothetical protein
VLIRQFSFHGKNVLMILYNTPLPWNTAGKSGVFFLGIARGTVIEIIIKKQEVVR